MNLAAWNNFFVAQVGASAGLAGLLFVAVSINLARIMAHRHLPIRAAEALLALFSVLMVSTFALVPGLSPDELGIAIAVTTGVIWIANTRALVRTWAMFEQYPRTTRILANQLPSLAFTLAGVLVATDHASGMWWVVAGTLLSFAAGVLGAWLLLIEIQR